MRCGQSATCRGYRGSLWVLWIGSLHEPIERFHGGIPLYHWRLQCSTGVTTIGNGQFSVAHNVPRSAMGTVIVNVLAELVAHRCIIDGLRKVDRHNSVIVARNGTRLPIRCEKIFNAECSKEPCYLSAAMLGVANTVVSLFGRGSVASTRNPTLHANVGEPEAIRG